MHPESELDRVTRQAAEESRRQFDEREAANRQDPLYSWYYDSTEPKTDGYDARGPWQTEDRWLDSLTILTGRDE